MSNINKIIKQGLENLLETKGFEDMEVAFGVKHKSDNLSDAEKNQFGPMGQLKTSEGGSYPNPKVPGTKEVEKANSQGGKDAQAYYKEVAKKMKDFQTPDSGQQIDGPRVPTNTGDDNERLETTGYDIGISGMEVTADLAAEKGGSKATKDIYKKRMQNLQGDKSNYTPMSKNAKETNDLKYKKDSRNTRPVKSQKSKQLENIEIMKTNINEEEGDALETQNVNSQIQLLINGIKDRVMSKSQYAAAIKKVMSSPVFKAQFIASMAKAVGIEDMSELSRSTGMIKKELNAAKNTEDSMEDSMSMGMGNMEENHYRGVDSKNIFKANGKLVSEEQVLKLANKVPSRVKIDETAFAITDGENTYKLIWEGDNETGEPIITNHKNNGLVNEDIQKMKYLWGFKPEKQKPIVKEGADDFFKKMLNQVKGK